MPKHELWELQSMQAAPLSVKVSLTKDRIREWIKHYGEDGVFVSFSGGKDSTVLLHLVREEYPDIPAVFVDVPTQYPELRRFAQTFDNVTILKPKMNFMQVCEKYGFPMISKEVSERIYYAQKYLTWWKNRDESLTDRQTDRTPSDKSWWIEDLFGIRGVKKINGIPKEWIEALVSANGNKINEVLNISIGKYRKKSPYDFSRYIFMVNAPFYLSNQCCTVMKKTPIHLFQKQTGKMPISAQMASESRRRTTSWLLHGCNSFDTNSPMSNPMAFWTEQDVLLYIYQNKIPICSVYGEVVKDTEIDGQLDFEDLGIFDLGIPVLTTTGCKRTGCMLCGFGCHLEKPGEGRFELLKRTHPKMYALLDVVKNNGYTMRQAIDWINEHENLNIRY